MNKMIVVLLSLLLFSCTQITGTSDETSTRVARVLNQDLSPASGVEVQLFASGDSSLTPDTIIHTDEDGYCRFHTAKEYYDLWAESDSFAAFEDSVYGQNDGTDPTLVLKKSGSVSGVVRMQPGDDPLSVYVKVLGTYKYCNVNADGQFTLNGLAQGDYTLLLVSTLPDYTPTFKEVTCFADSAVVLDDTVDMTYSGVPFVQGIVAEYDSITGETTISWNKSSYQFLDRYIIYLRSDEGPFSDRTRIGMTTDSFFVDTTAAFLASSTDGVRYSVSILSLDGTEGSAFATAGGTNMQSFVTTESAVTRKRFISQI